MSKFSNLFKQYSLTALAVFVLATFCAAQQPTAKAQPRPPRPAPAGRVTRATVRAVVPAGKPCPVTVNLNGAITTSGPVEVKYTWTSSDNSTWPEHTINFTKAGTQNVAETWSLNKNYTGWVQLKVVSPNALMSPRANFKVTCGAAGGAGKVTRAMLGAIVSGGAGPCPKTVTFNGAITTNGAAEVKYTWVSMDGGTWPEHTIKFAKAGTEKVTESRSAPSNQTGWMQLKVVSPNALLSPRANYRVSCVTAHKK